MNSSSQLPKEPASIPQKDGSYKNIWFGSGRQRIMIPKTVLKSMIYNNPLFQPLHIVSMGFYPHAHGHYTYRKKGLPENFVFYCTAGHGWYKLGKTEYKVGPGEFFFLPQGVEHAYGSDAQDPWSIYWVHFGGNALPQFNQMQVAQAALQPKHIRGGEQIVALFQRMYKSLELGFSTDNLGFANLCLGHFLSLFLYPNRHFEAAQPQRTSLVDQAIHYMQDHIKSNLTLQQICSEHHYSPSRFSSLFRQQTGYAPIDYFIQMKMQQASQMLDLTDKSVKDIAANFGFDDPYYFSRRFRKVYGVSPKQYRTLHKDQ